jgi:undecaprenyl-diphosphatase
MALADARRAPGERAERDAGPLDGLALGLAQAVALIPGVSRHGAALTAARACGFTRVDAHTLSWHAGLPVMLGASGLKGARLARHGTPPGAAAPLAAGAAGAFASTLIGARLLRRPACARRSLLPYSLYRCVLAALAVARLRAGGAASSEQI